MSSDRLNVWRTWALRCLVVSSVLGIAVGLAYDSTSNILCGVLGLITTSICVLSSRIGQRSQRSRPTN